ncbi:hypothetical protein F6455_09475 [Proteobacteria bacterium 005FR1]|nr:hypothetical protein [Proteobacteria bacterium 005FR1]
MTVEEPNRELFTRFRLPPTDLAQLSFCKSNRPAAVKSWAQSLPATRVSYTSVVLYKALPELARLKTSADNRLEMLEAVRPYVQDCIQGLAKHFLNQPLVLSEAPMKSAVIAQALQKHMCSAYIEVARELASRSKKGKQADSRLPLALHRAMTGYGLILLRNYQLYSQTPGNLWLDLHTLYRIAEHNQLLDQAVKDQLLRESGSCTLTQAYVRVLLLACARPNQMRQTDVAATYDVLESWAHLAKVQQSRQGDSDNVFVINLDSDLAPLYKSRFTGGIDDTLRELNIDALLSAFRQQGHSRSGALRIPHIISSALVEHLRNAWGSRLQRSFERQPGRGLVQVCVGISSFHHHTSGEQSLHNLLGIDEGGEFELGEYTELGATDTNTPARREDFPIYTAAVGNSSPGGYRLDWNENISAQLKAGEVVGLREVGRHRWALGVIRWLQQVPEGTQLGVQLLAPKATAYGAAVEQANGDYSDYRRVLMLPELKAANQPATLVTAFAPFQEGRRIRLNRQGEISTATLQRRLFSTGSMSQFTFRRIAAEDDQAAENKNADSNADWD